jgi:hypothetical protein
MRILQTKGSCGSSGHEVTLGRPPSTYFATLWGKRK